MFLTSNPSLTSMIIYVSISPSNCCDRLPIPLVISCGKTTVTSHPEAGGFVPSAHVFIEKQICARLQDSCTNKDAVADLGEPPPPLILGKKRRNDRKEKSQQGKQIRQN